MAETQKSKLGFLPKTKEEFEGGIKPLSDRAVALKDCAETIIVDKLGLTSEAVKEGAKQQYNRTVMGYGYLMAYAPAE